MRTKTVQRQKERSKKITILAGDCGRDYMARTGREAIQMFFRDITGGCIKLCQLSPIASWNDGTEPIYFRIAPVLFTAGLMTLEEVDATLRQADADLEFTLPQLRANGGSRYVDARKLSICRRRQRKGMTTQDSPKSSSPAASQASNQT